MKEHFKRNKNTWTIVGIVLTIVLAATGVVYGYGTLNNQVSVNTTDIAEVQEEIKALPRIDERTLNMQEQMNRLEDYFLPD